MRWKALRTIGLVLVVLSFAGLFLRAVAAALKGQSFMGMNVYHLPVGTYSTLAMFAVLALAGGVLLVRRIVMAVRSRRSDRPGAAR